jgi:hypothetical protein
MKEFLRGLLWAAILAGVCCGAAMAAGLSTVGQWSGKYPFDRIANGKSLWDQPGVQAAMRAAMGKRFFALSQKEMHGPEGPVAGDGKGLFAAWSCKAHDCGGNQMTVFFDTAAGTAQVCWRSAGDGGKVQDLWLANGKARPLPINACGYGENDPFAALKKFGGAG